jgi:hypothetical protein
VIALASNDSGLKVFRINDAYQAPQSPSIASTARSGKIKTVLPSPHLDFRIKTSESYADRRDLVIQASSNCHASMKIRRFGFLDTASFQSFAEEGRPFLLSGVVKDWPLAKLTPALLMKTYGSLRVTARVKDYVEKGFSKDRTFVETTLSEYFTLLAQPYLGNPAYLGNQELPELAALCKWPAYFDRQSKTKIWLGPEGTVTPLHADYDDNLFAQLWGKKQFTLYPPQSAASLYVTEANPVLYGSAFNPEVPDYDMYPLAKQLKSISCEVAQGDLLYLPAGWFHHVRAREFSLSANLWSQSRPRVLSAKFRWNS